MNTPINNALFFFFHILQPIRVARMSWSDIFYPDNPKRREEVVRRSQQLYDLMEGNFRATNDLIDCLHTYVPGRTFLKIFVDTTGTIRSNCKRLIQRIREIQDYIEGKNKKLRELLEPSIYKKLMNVDTSFSDKFRMASKITSVALGIVCSAIGTIVICCIKSGAILTNIVSSIGVVATSAIAVLCIGALIVGVDMLFSAIFGAIERDRLNEAIDDLKANLKTFEPASVGYTKNIHKVIAYIEITTQPL